MNTELTNYTTTDIMKLENAGGFLTLGVAPDNLILEPVEVWITSMPQVDEQLVIAWYSMHSARRMLETRLEELEGVEEWQKQLSS